MTQLHVCASNVKSEQGSTLAVATAAFETACWPSEKVDMGALCANQSLQHRCTGLGKVGNKLMGAPECAWRAAGTGNAIGQARQRIRKHLCRARLCHGSLG